MGRYSEFVQEILRQVDDDLDLAAFDDDGPDGRPDSGDDDGEVDLIVVLTPALPRNFLFGGATGIRDLGLLETVATSDPGADGRPIGYRTGLVAQGLTFAEAAGTVAHELGHTLFALPDLYNVAYLHQEERDPAGDSAGIGNWGLMGWGALGWGGDGRARELLRLEPPAPGMGAGHRGRRAVAADPAAGRGRDGGRWSASPPAARSISCWSTGPAPPSTTGGFRPRACSSGT